MVYCRALSSLQSPSAILYLVAISSYTPQAWQLNLVHISVIIIVFSVMSSVSAFPR
jgi:cytochrome c biogenesis factor